MKDQSTVSRVCLTCGKTFLANAASVRRGWGKYCAPTCMRFPRRTPRVYPPLTERFWQYVEKGDGCWQWKAGRNKSGYGTTSKNRKSVLAHRVAWELTNGPIPPGLCVLHRCDNRLCCNPSHLRLGTNADNVADRSRKGRGRAPDQCLHGEDVPTSKLTAVQVLEIRARWSSGGVTQEALGDAYGVSQTAIGKIVRGVRWKHLI